MFWACVLFGALSYVLGISSRWQGAIMQYPSDAAIRQDKTPTLFYALMVALVLASPFLAIASLFDWFRNSRSSENKSNPTR